MITDDKTVILGLHFGHDAGVSILINGIAKCNLIRERYNRSKHSFGVNVAHIEEALLDAKVKIESAAKQEKLATQANKKNKVCKAKRARQAKQAKQGKQAKLVKQSKQRKQSQAYARARKIAKYEASV